MEYDLRVVTGAAAGDGGVPHGALLARFAEAVLADDETRLGRAREALAAAIQPAGLVDAAGVAGLFNAIDRVADATGIPIDPERVVPSARFRAALGIDRFAVANRG